jgi:hypothetical protein
MKEYVLVQKWQPIATAPPNAELELSIYDKAEYHALVCPCQRDSSARTCASIVPAARADPLAALGRQTCLMKATVLVVLAEYLLWTGDLGEQS